MAVKLMTYQDLALILQISPKSLMNAIAKRPDQYPPKVRIGKWIRFHPDTVERWLKAKDARGQKLFGDRA